MKWNQNLYDDHDGEEFSNDKSTWTKDLFSEQCTKLIMNFSKERLNFLLKLCKYVFPEGKDNRNSKTDNNKYYDEEFEKRFEEDFGDLFK